MKSTPATHVLAMVLLVGAPMASATAATASPPADDPAVFEPAPMPNRDLYAPAAPASDDPKIEPNFFRNNTQFRGDGFSPGSTSQSYEERRVTPGYGVNFLLPLK